MVLMRMSSFCYLRLAFRRMSYLVIAAGIVLSAVAAMFVLKPSAVEAAAPAGSDGAVRAAVAKLPAYVRQVMKKTGVPGVAVAVVHENKLIYAEGFGVRSTVSGGVVTPETVFQVASVSKPVGATAVAAAISKGYVKWSTPVAPLLPGFSMANPDVSGRVTIGDLYAHRSGLPGHFGNDLEVLGFDRQYIFEKARLEPLAHFRTAYAYSNFGLTAGGVAAANAVGKDWTAMTRDFLFAPLGMSRSSYSHAMLAQTKNVASLHQQVRGRWVPGPMRNAEAQAPAGGFNSSVMDLARWMRMVLAEGMFEGRRIIAKAPLEEMLSIQFKRAEDGEGGASGQGFGMEVLIDSKGSTTWLHPGNFQAGASTQVYFIPEFELGIVTLTNGWPVGVPEAISATFDDWVRFGQSTQDWLQVTGAFFAPLITPTFMIDGQTLPQSPKPAGALASYAGRYVSEYAGDARVIVEKGRLVLTLGPKGKTRIPLRHWDSDVFFYNDLVLPEGFYHALRFNRDSQKNVTSLMMDEINSGLGMFERRR